MTLAPAFLDELRARVSVSTVVGRRVKLSRAGREMKGCCPFHNEKSPSFFVNDDKGFYHCFGCGAHGDVIRFVVEQEGLGFIDAVKSLAQEAGLELPEQTPEARERTAAVVGLHDITAAAALHFAGQLADTGGAAARQYLEQRRVTAATAKAFGLGFAADSRSRLRTALASHGDAKLIETGLLIQPESDDGSRNGEPYDRFRGRLMFPIRDPRGRVIGFGGRILGDGQPKYLNSPDTPLFDKGRTLYNLDKAGPVARKSQRLIVVEGYMDVIGLAQAGFADAVAPLGTALTEAQMALMWRLVPEPILCFDGDAAGQRAGLRAALRALPLLEPGKSLRFATLPPGQDPDDLVRDGGAVALDAVLAAARPLHEIIWDAVVAEAGADTPEQKASIKSKLRELALSIHSADVRTTYDQAFRDRFYRTFGRTGDYRAPVLSLIPSNAAEMRNINLLESELRALLVGVMNYPHVASELFEVFVRIPHSRELTKNLAQRIIEAMTWAPELDRFGLALWLKKEGFRDAAIRVRNATRLQMSFTTLRRRVNHAVEDLKIFTEGLAEYYQIQDEWEQACIRAKASHGDGTSTMLMDEIEATKQSLLERRDALRERLYEYTQSRPVDEYQPNELDWEWPAGFDSDPAANDNFDVEAPTDSQHGVEAAYAYSRQRG